MSTQECDEFRSRSNFGRLACARDDQPYVVPIYGDSSRWVADVFHNRPLAVTIRKAEQRYRLGRAHDLSNSVAAAIRERCEFSSVITSEAEVGHAH
jgi:hypothetical protein